MDEKRQLLGIIVEGDIRRHLTVANNFLDLPVKQVMNPNPKLILSDALAFDALKLMEDKARLVYVLPVVDDQNKLQGIIRLHDLMKEGLVTSK